MSVSQQREQLVLAEKLFGMDITGYPDLVQVCCSIQETQLCPVQAVRLLQAKLPIISYGLCAMSSRWRTRASSAWEQPVQSHACRRDHAGLKLEL